MNELSVVQEEAIEAILDGSGLTWSRRETGWAIPAGGSLPRELHIVPGPTAIRVEAVLVEIDQIGSVQAEALTHYLTAAQAWLSSARYELDGGSVRVVALVQPAQLESDLEPHVRAVAAGCRLLAREVRALLVPEAAREYVAFHGTK
jgi:hypothetical protein